MPNNKILTSTNTALTVTNLAASPSPGTATLEGVPLGTSDGSATGELGVKVLSVGTAPGTSDKVQGTTANTGVFTDNPVIIGGVDPGGNAAQLTTTSDGTLKNQPSAASAATLANKNYSAASQVLAASNSLRRGLFLFNDTDGVLYVKFGATASTTSFTVKVLVGFYYEMPPPMYTGTVDAIGTGGTTGAIRVTEIT